MGPCCGSSSPGNKDSFSRLDCHFRGRDPLGFRPPDGGLLHSAKRFLFSAA